MGEDKMTAWKESIYGKYPWIIPVVPFIILFSVGFFVVSYSPQALVETII